jgi:ankyrin repeat protein
MGWCRIDVALGGRICARAAPVVDFRLHRREGIGQDWRMERKTAEQKAHEALIPLLYAIDDGRRGTVERLITRGAHLNPKVDVSDFHYHSPPLVRAAATGDEVICEMLINAGADVMGRSGNGFSALHVAAGDGHPEACKVLIQAGAVVDDRDPYGETPLFHAIRQGSFEVFAILLDSGADPDARSLTNATPLHYAASQKELDMLEALLRRGVPVDVAAQAKASTTTGLRELHGAGIVTALHAAIERPGRAGVDWVGIVGLLTSNGADPSFRPDEVHDKYQSPLQRVIDVREYVLVRHFLLDCKPDLRQITSDGLNRTLADLAGGGEPVLASGTKRILEWLRAAEVAHVVDGAVDLAKTTQPTGLRPAFGPI